MPGIQFVNPFRQSQGSVGGFAGQSLVSLKETADSGDVWWFLQQCFTLKGLFEHACDKVVVCNLLSHRVSNTLDVQAEVTRLIYTSYTLWCTLGHGMWRSLLRASCLLVLAFT